MSSIILHRSDQLRNPVASSRFPHRGEINYTSRGTLIVWKRWCASVQFEKIAIRRPPFWVNLLWWCSLNINTQFFNTFLSAIPRGFFEKQKEIFQVCLVSILREDILFQLSVSLLIHYKEKKVRIIVDRSPINSPIHSPIGWKKHLFLP